MRPQQNGLIHGDRAAGFDQVAVGLAGLSVDDPVSGVC